MRGIRKTNSSAKDYNEEKLLSGRTQSAVLIMIIPKPSKMLIKGPKLVFNTSFITLRRVNRVVVRRRI